MTRYQMRAYEGSADDWNRLVSLLPAPHLLQTWEWAQVKGQFGWQAMPLVWDDGAAGVTHSGGISLPSAAAMVLKRSVLRQGFARRLCILYVPKGPILEWNDANLRARVLDDLQVLARKQDAILLKIDPDFEIGRGYPSSDVPNGSDVRGDFTKELQKRNWRFSADQVQFRNTIVLDLAPAEDALLAAMKQKTRYNIRLAQKKGVTVRIETRANLTDLYRMYAETSDRDGFVIRNPDYYRAVWETFLHPPIDHTQPSAEVLAAEVEGVPVAAIIVFYFAKRAYYLYGMSRAEHRDKMPNHLLQWEAIRRAKHLGCTTYDLWGAPDDPDVNDRMWGVYRFKEGLGGEVVRTAGAWDYPAGPLWYAVFTRLVPRVLDIMRARGRQQVRQTIGGP